MCNKAFQKIVKDSGHKPNNILVDKVNEIYNILRRNLLNA